MNVEWATVVPGSETPAGDGISGAQRCVLVLANEALVGAVLKKDPPEQVYAEVLCGRLLQSWHLPVPDPYLVQDGPNVWFASADAGYPNLKKRVGLDLFPIGSPAHTAAMFLACQLAKSLPTAPLAAVADEAIDNRDRNLGNILWDGTDEAWIDHALALGNGAAKPDVNKLCQMAVGTGDYTDFMNAAMGLWPMLNGAEVDKHTASLSIYYGTSAWRSYIANRLSTLGMRLVSRFPSPPGLFNPPATP